MAAEAAGRVARRDLLALGALCALVLLFLLPALMMWAPVCYCDSPVESVPRVIAIARALQSGGLPLWDFNTFAGARPFYVANESAIFYPVMYPLYLLAHVDDVRAATFLLTLLPYVLHVLWAAAGGYLFARLVLRLHPVGAFVLGLVYALSPEMAVQIITPDVAYLFSYLPWIMLAVARFIETGSRRWWLAGTVFVALMTSVGTMNFVIRVYFVTAATIALLWLFSLRSFRQRSALYGIVQGLRLRVLATAGGMLALGAALNGFAWAGVLEGIGWMSGLGKLTAAAASDMWTESSMPPPYIESLFSPTFFGVLDNRHGWGIALSEGVTNLSALGGGVALMMALFGALLFWLPHSANDEGERTVRCWTWIALLTFVGALLTMMGRYTPVFDWLCAVLPWFFRIPHAVYYRFAESWALAVLVAIGVSSMWTLQEFRDSVGRWWLPAACMVFGGGGAAMILLGPAAYSEDSDTALSHLNDYHEWGWFLSGPVLCFAGASVILLAAFLLLSPRARGRVLLVVVCVETVGFAIPAFYRSLLFEQTRVPPQMNVAIQDERVMTMADHPHYELVPRLRALESASGVRFAGYNSRIDNQAWTANARAAFGYSSKPLAPRYQDLVQRFSGGMPYDLMLLDTAGKLDPAGAVENLRALTFLRNMNVGYVAGDLSQPPTWMSQTRNLSLNAVPDPLPYAYLQDRVVILDSERQKERLEATDLRRAVYVDPEFALSVPRSDDPGAGALTPEDAQRFNALQRRDRVLRIDQSRANAMTIELDMEAAAMLVLAEVWHPGWRASVDGQAAPVSQVNYLQQGVWLGPGKHTVRLTFFPPSLEYGAVVSALAVLALLLIAALPPLRRRTNSV